MTGFQDKSIMKKFFSAHIIMYFEPIGLEKYLRDHGGEEGDFVVWENIVLFSGVDAEEVLEKARERGRKEETEGDESLTRDDQPMRIVFGGVRKIVECDCSEEGVLGEGDELTYSEMIVEDRNDLNKLIHGEEVHVNLQDN
jgi:hypothetical protein